MCIRDRIKISNCPSVLIFRVLILTSITCEELNNNKDFESINLSISKNLYISFVEASRILESSGFLYGSWAIDPTGSS